MSNPQSDLWQQLHDAGIVTGEMPNTVDIEVTPWYIGHTVFDRSLLRVGETVHMQHLVRYAKLLGLSRFFR